MAYVRTVRTASGAIAVQIVHSSRRGSRDIEHLGSAHDEAELAALSRPSIVFRGAKCSHPAVKEPIAALVPSEITVTAFGTKIAGMSRR